MEKERPRKSLHFSFFLFQKSCFSIFLFNFGDEMNKVMKYQSSMSNKRDLKRYVNYVCSELFAEGLAAQLYGVNKEREHADTVLASILKVHNDFVGRVSHPEPGIAPKTYYGLLKEDFSKQVNELIDQINALF